MLPLPDWEDPTYASRTGLGLRERAFYSEFVIRAMSKLWIEGDTLQNTIYGAVRTRIIEPHANAPELPPLLVRSVILSFSSSCFS